MRIQRTCKICGKTFPAIKTTQFFCCRKCFKRDYYLRTKIHLLEQKQNPKYPTKKCGFCKKTFKLNFDPIKFPHLYNAWRCPDCGTPNELVWKYQTKQNSHQIISSFLISFSAEIRLDTTPQYHPYHLPVVRPEQGNPAYVVMTCEMLNILDLQKGDRKKIIFS